MASVAQVGKRTYRSLFDPALFYRRRTARKQHVCQWGSCPHDRTIQPGEAYFVLTEYPGGESGYADYARRPTRMNICGRCAKDSDMVHELDPPTHQAYALGVV
jgi:hypothetical protein